MASIGLAIAQGNNLYQQDVQVRQENAKRQEELDRFLMSRALYETQLANETIQADNTNKELSYFQDIYNNSQPFFEGITKGDAQSFLAFSDANNLGYSYNSSKNTWMKDDKDIGALTGPQMQAIASEVIVMPVENFNQTSAELAEQAAIEAERQHEWNLAVLGLRPAAGNSSSNSNTGLSDIMKDTNKLLDTPDEKQYFNDMAISATIHQLYDGDVQYIPQTGEIAYTGDKSSAALSEDEIQKIHFIADKIRVKTASQGFTNIEEMENFLIQNARNEIASQKYGSGIGPIYQEQEEASKKNNKKQSTNRASLPETPLIIPVGEGVSAQQVNYLAPTIGTGIKYIGSTINNAANTAAQFLEEKIVTPYLIQ